MNIILKRGWEDRIEMEGEIYELLNIILHRIARVIGEIQQEKKLLKGYASKQQEHIITLELAREEALELAEKINGGKIMRNGDILLFRGRGLMSKIIQWGTRSPYSHVAICVNADMNLLIEAQGCVRAQDIRKITNYDVFRVKKRYTYKLDKVISFLVSKLNEKYDYAGVIFLGIMKLFRLKKMANKWQKDRDYFCSELAYKAFKNGDLQIVDKEDAGVVSPADIANSDVICKI